MPSRTLHHVLFFYNWYRKLAKHRNRNHKTSPEENDAFRKLHRFKYWQLKRATRGFSERQKLGKGGFGVVYRGILRNGREVAIKRLDHLSLQGEREFDNEVSICGSLSSPYVVNLIGYCAQGKRIRLLVYEYMENRSLQDALFDQGYPVRLDWSKRLKIINDTAKALQFLHLQCDPPIIHGDIKPSNILLDSSFSARIADFGLSRFKSEDHYASDNDDRYSTYSGISLTTPATPKVVRYGALEQSVTETVRQSAVRNHRVSENKLSGLESQSVKNELFLRKESPHKSLGEQKDLIYNDTHRSWIVNPSPDQMMQTQDHIVYVESSSPLKGVKLDIESAYPISKESSCSVLNGECLVMKPSYPDLKEEKVDLGLAYLVSKEENLVMDSSYPMLKDVRVDIVSAYPVWKEEKMDIESTYALLNNEENLVNESSYPVLNDDENLVVESLQPVPNDEENLVMESSSPLVKEVKMDMRSMYPLSKGEKMGMLSAYSMMRKENLLMESSYPPMKEVRMDMECTCLVLKEERLVEEVCTNTQTETLANGINKLDVGNRDEEMIGKKYVMDWLGSELGSKKVFAKPEKLVPVDEELHTINEAKKSTLSGRPRREKRAKSMSTKGREWWKDEYFAELNSKTQVKENAMRKKMSMDFFGWEFSGETMRNEQSFRKEGIKSMSKEWFRNAMNRRERRSRRMHSMVNDAFWDGELSYKGYTNKESSINHQQWSGELTKIGESSIRDISSTTSMRGTICYVAPEYGPNGLGSEKGDIYSFGVLMLVILSGRRPIQVSASPMKEFERANLISWARSLSHSGKILDLVDASLGGEYDKKQVHLCITLALLCLQRVPTCRPDISDVVKILSGEVILPSSPSNRSPSRDSKFNYKMFSQSPKQHHSLPTSREIHVVNY